MNGGCPCNVWSMLALVPMAVVVPTLAQTLTNTDVVNWKLGLSFWATIACVMAYYIYTGKQRQEGWKKVVDNQTSFVLLREYLPACSALLMVSAGITGSVGKPFEAESGLQMYVYIMMLAWGIQLSLTHVFMLYARHLKNWLIATPLVLVQCTFSQTLYWTMYFLFRSSTKAKLDSTLASKKDACLSVILQVDISFVLSVSIIMYRLWVTAITYWGSNKVDSWVERYHKHYFLVADLPTKKVA